MDHALIAQVARLKVRLRQDAGISLNTRRFFEEAAYGQSMLEQAEDSDDVELVALAMGLRHQLGWLAASPRVIAAPHGAIAARPHAPEAGGERPTAGRYLFGARS